MTRRGHADYHSGMPNGLSLLIVFLTVVLHDFTLARQLADQALLLDGDGRLSAFGPAGTVITPAVLESVFRTPFLEIDGPDGPVILPTEG